jgi:PAS domain S-box-containing protein
MSGKKFPALNLCEMTRLYLIRRVQFGFGLVLAILFFVGLLSYRTVVASREGDRWVGHTHEVLENLESLLSATQNVDTGYRTFVLMGDAQSLQLYRSGVLRTSQEQKTIRALTADNPNQGTRLATLAGLTEQKIQFGEALIRLRQTKDQEVAVKQIRGGQGIRVMEEIRAVIRNMEEEERQLLSQRDAESERRSRQTKTVVLLGSGLGLLVAAGAGWTVRHEFAARKLAEDALREGAERFRTMANNISQLAWMADEKGGIFWYNERWFEYSGTTLEEMAGWGWQKVHHPDHVQRVVDKISQCFQRGEVWEDTFPLRGRDGNYRWFLSRAVPIRDPEGRVLRWFGTNTDISESKESEAKYRGLLEAAPDAMVVVNQGGEIVLLNVQVEKQFGYRRDELVGQKVKNIIPEGFAERLIADALRSAEDTLAQEIGAGIELNGRHKNGREFPIEIMLSPLESTEGILVTAAIRDITKRKKAEAQLLQKVEELNRSNDELQQFAYVASHDLQEPLRMVASYTQLLANRYKGRLDADADEFIAYAVDGSNRMQRLIQDLLAYSRAGTNGNSVRKISSENALKAAVTNLRAMIEESGAVVTHDSLPAITTNDTQLTQIFQNLVGNAIKYHGAEVPRVHVSAGKNGGKEWIFSVQDNGLGIDRQHFERIFVLFQRLHGRAEFDGTGIGLAICKKIVERQGGRIWVESQTERGSTFHFALPDGGGK